MRPLTRADLMSLEHYEQVRHQFRERVSEHKKNRTVRIGEHVVLHFEDRLTMHYQIQEILRAEKIFQADAIEEELTAYNPLISDGGNWKATMMIQYPEAETRRKQLARLIGIDLLTWVKVGDREKIFPVSDEDLDRQTEDKTSAVHFLRFELDQGSVAAALGDAPVSAGCDHRHYSCEVTLAENVRTSLLVDLQS